MLETLVAAVLFMSAAVGSLQLWGAAAGGSQAQLQRQGLRDQIDRDRLLLERHWRQQWARSQSCPTAEQLRAAAMALPVADSLQRQLRADADGVVLKVHWPEGQRQLWFTAAGLGLC
ncbi:MAG: hypothetical protein RLZZ346_1958 [Cyanobacteriota bacterium]